MAKVTIKELQEQLKESNDMLNKSYKVCDEEIKKNYDLIMQTEELSNVNNLLIKKLKKYEKIESLEEFKIEVSSYIGKLEKELDSTEKMLNNNKIIYDKSLKRRKEIVASLQNANEQLNDDIQKLISEKNKDIDKGLFEAQLKESNNKNNELNNIINNLISENENYKNINDHLKNDINKLISKKDKEKEAERIHNERGAGRKSRLTEEDKEEMKKMREEGKTIKDIAIKFNCSVAIIHRYTK